MPGSIGIENVSQVVNPQMTFLWEVSFPRLPGGVDFTGIKFVAQAAGIPPAAFETIERWYQGQSFRFPGRANYSGTITLTLEEQESADQIQRLDQWRNLMRDVRTGEAAVATIQEMKGDMILSPLNRQGQIGGVSFLLFGVYPEDIAGVDLQQDSNERLERTVTISYDFWEVGASGQRSAGF